MPKLIGKSFPNLIFIEFIDCDLIELNKNDLQQFGANLESINLSGNSLTKLNAGLFEFNPNLDHIKLNSNPLKMIEIEFFNNLGKLKKLNDFMLSGGCVGDEQIEIDKFMPVNAVNQISKEILNKCK